MKTSNITRKKVRIISFCVAVITVLSVATISLYFKAQNYKMQVELSRQRALSELSESVDAIVLVLQKGQYSSSYNTMSRLSSSLNAESRCAKAALSEIENSDIYTADIYKFLSQIGDYTNSVTSRLATGEKTDKSDSETMSSLLAYAQQLSSSLSSILSSYYDGTLSFEKSKSNLSLYANSDESEAFSDSFSSAEQGLQDYPTLIYDGPFSDHMSSKEAKAVKGLAEVTRSEAKTYASEITGVDESRLKNESDENGQLYLYCFSTDTLTVGITKSGGKLCYMINSEYEGESTLSQSSTVDRAAKFLKKLGYGNMTDTYYSTYDGVCTVNFAYKESGIVCYPDLIKVSVSLETGRIVGLDARAYLMNHFERTLKKPSGEAAKKAREKINPDLEILGEKTAVIPTQSDTEYLCFEFHCKDENSQEVLIYIDCESFEEREILIMLYTDGGILTQ